MNRLGVCPVLPLDASLFTCKYKSGPEARRWMQESERSTDTDRLQIDQQRMTLNNRKKRETSRRSEKRKKRRFVLNIKIKTKAGEEKKEKEEKEGHSQSKTVSEGTCIVLAVCVWYCYNTVTNKRVAGQ